MAHLFVEASGDAFAAACSASEVVGDLVYVSGPAIAGLPQVARCDPFDTAKMPAIGVIFSKSSGTRCLVVTVGQVAASGPLTPGGRYFAGADGRPLLGPPPPGPGAPVLWQHVGVALDASHLQIQPSPVMHRRQP